MLNQIVRRLRELWEGDPRDGVFSDHDPDGKHLLARIRGERARLATEYATVVQLRSCGAPLLVLAANIDVARHTAERGLDLTEVYLHRVNVYGFPQEDAAEVNEFAGECLDVLSFRHGV